MQIKAGTIAPNFETKDIFGKPIQLEDYRGKKLLLSFYRMSACALCNLRVHQLIKHYPAWQASGLEIVAVFESPLENMRQYVGKQAAPFPLIADPEAKLYELYGVEVSEDKVNATMANPAVKTVIAEAAAAGFALTKEEGSNFYRIPAEFLIDADGRVAVAHYSEIIFDHMPIDQIEQFATLVTR